MLELAEEHGVAGVVTQRLELDGFSGIPAGTREKLQERMRLQHLFTLGMMAELLRILEEFAKAGIGTLLVKGPVVSELAYGNAAVRSYSDLDLLVRDGDILRAWRCMTALGFTPNIPEEAIQVGKIPGDYIFLRPGTQRMVELHTERSFRYFPRQMRIDDFFARQRRAMLDKREVPALALEDEFTLNCIHGAKHFWERLIWVTDAATIVVHHAEMNWDRVRQSAEAVGAGRMVRAGLLLGETLFGVKVPEAMKASVNSDSTARGLVAQILGWLPRAGYAPPPLPKRAMFRLQIGGGGAAGIAYLLRLSLTPTEEDWEKGEEERGWRVWEAVKRPFRLIRKYGQDG